MLGKDKALGMIPGGKREGEGGTYVERGRRGGRGEGKEERKKRKGEKEGKPKERRAHVLAHKLS